MNIELTKFSKFLTANGAEILRNTNPYELVRFKANGSIGIIYEGKRGFSFVGEAEKAYNCFQNQAPWSGALKNTNPIYLRSVKLRTLFERDGDKCFYCNRSLGEDVTIEHLLARNCGGSNHINNLALAHYDCNLKASHLPIVKKIEFKLNKENGNE